VLRVGNLRNAEKPEVRRPACPPVDRRSSGVWGRWLAEPGDPKADLEPPS